MVTRIIKKVSNFDKIKDTFNAMHGVSSPRYAGSEVWNMEAETIIAEIADGDATIYKSTAYAIKDNDFEAKDAMKIDALVRTGFTVYVVNNTDYRKIKNMYERTYA